VILGSIQSLGLTFHKLVGRSVPHREEDRVGRAGVFKSVASLSEATL
jgi:hypothetical protein